MKTLKKYQFHIFIAFILTISFSLCYYLGRPEVKKAVAIVTIFIIIVLLWVIYQLRFARCKPGTGSTVFLKIACYGDSGDKSHLIQLAQIEGKIPDDYFFARITSRKVNPEDESVTYAIEYWEERKVDETLSVEN